MSVQKKLAASIIQSIFFKKAQKKAKGYAKNTRKLAELLIQVNAKSKNLDGNNHYAAFLDNLGTLRRMLRAYKQGDYTQLPWRSVVLIIAALIYFVSPLDFIPDILPILGLTDDIAVILWVYNSIKSDIDLFKKWESQQFVPVSEK